MNISRWEKKLLDLSNARYIWFFLLLIMARMSNWSRSIKNRWDLNLVPQWDWEDWRNITKKLFLELTFLWSNHIYELILPGSANSLIAGTLCALRACFAEKRLDTQQIHFNGRALCFEPYTHALLRKILKNNFESLKMGINRTEKLKPDLKSARNSESSPGCPMESIDHEHGLLWERLDHFAQVS